MTDDVKSQSSDRLSFTLFLAAAFHAILIFGISFTVRSGDTVAPTLNITLATHKSASEPKKADFLAQHNQEASGTASEVKELTTDIEADFTDVNINDVTPLTQQQARIETNESKTHIINTKQKSDRSTSSVDSKEKEIQRDAQDGDAEQLVPQSQEFSSLKAKLDKLRQAQAKEPRIRRHTSMSTKASYDALYLNNWTAKIERIGNENFPAEALKNSLQGNLRILVGIYPNGAVQKVEILQSSGHTILDSAAVQIIRLASPFDPFPAEIRKNTDILEIIRTLRFEITGDLTTSQ